MLKQLAAALAAVLTVAVARADEAKEKFVAPQTIEELDQRIAEALKDTAVIGVEVALVDRNGASWAKGYGYLDKEKTRPVENDSIFRAGSISKSFTGALALMLVEDGILDLNATLREAAPAVEFKNKWEDTDPVRLVDLSEHTSGWDDIQFSEYRDFGPNVTPIEGLAANPISRTSRWRPGRYASYCNAGPVALAIAIENATGRKFEDLVDERIFRPLGINEASFFLTEAVAAKISKSYSDKGVEEPYLHIGLRPSGSLNISASELAKFVALMIRRGEMNGTPLISPEGVARIETPTRALSAKAGLTLGYGLGNYASFVDDRLFFGHNGAIDGFFAQYSYSKETDTGFVIMSNTSAGDPLQKVRKLVAAYLLKDAPQPAAAPAGANVDLAQYEGYYRQIAPRSDLTRILIETIDVARFYEKDGKLVVAPPFGGGVTLVPLGDGLFTAEGRSVADRVFLTTPEGEIELHRLFQAAYRKLPLWQAYGPLAFLGLTALALSLSVLFALIWIVARPFGAFRDSNRWRVWAWPLLGVLSIGIVLGAFMIGSSGSGSQFLARLGAPSPWSWAIAIGTWGVPVFGAIGLLAALRAPDVSGFARVHAGVTSAILVALAIFLWSYGWLGMTVWSYAPAIVGS